MRPSDWAWIVLATGVVIWDVVCEPGEMLSEASARYAKNHPLIAYVVIGAVAAHLSGSSPRWADPIHGIGVILRRVKR